MNIVKNTQNVCDCGLMSTWNLRGMERLVKEEKLRGEEERERRKKHRSEGRYNNAEVGVGEREAVSPRGEQYTNVDSL